MRWTVTLLLLVALCLAAAAAGLYRPPEGGFAEVPGDGETSLGDVVIVAGGSEAGYLGAMLGLLGRVYDGWLSVQDGPRCRFTPTCSAYARGALSRYGLFEGWLLSWGRLLRCHRSIPRGLYPIVRFGYDGAAAAWGLPAYPECGAWAPLNLDLYRRELRGHLLDPLP